MDPATAIIVASALASAAHAGSSAISAHKVKKAKTRESKIRAKEMRRETISDLINQANERQSDIANQRLANSANIGRGRARSLQDTASSFREALNI